MEQSPTSHDPQSSRKRHRSDDMSTASFRLPHSAPTDTTSKRAPHRPHLNHSQHDNDTIPPTSADISNHVLEPLHPPIPNFSAISHTAPRPNPTPHPVPDPPAPPPPGIVYNIALPLPNPGRAHRFCQACDHINHVRRKLCTNCGAPKPSAVRNAVGVRSITEVETSADRRQSPDAAFRPEYSHPQLISTSLSPSHHNPNSRFNPSPYSQPDQRAQKPPEHSLHQARSLAMKCPDDDIPLLGNSAKPASSLSSADLHASRQFRPGQALLCEPLVNFSKFHTSEARPQLNSFRNPQPNHVDFAQTQKLFPEHPDRDQYTLPSMHGMQNQRLVHAPPAYKPQPRSDIADSRIPVNTPQQYEKIHDEPLVEDVLSLNRTAIPNHQDSREVDRRYSNTQGARHPARDITEHTQMYNPMQDTQAHSGLLYKPSHDFYQVQQQQQFRADDRDQGYVHDASRRHRLVHTMGDPNQDHFRGYSQPQDVQRYQVGGRALEPTVHIRNVFDVDRVRGIAASDNRMVHGAVSHLHKPEDEVSATPYEEPNRHPDESRYALENLLMQRKSNSTT